VAYALASQHEPAAGYGKTGKRVCTHRSPRHNDDGAGLENFALLLFELRDYALLLEAREILDKNLAVQMIDLMLDTHREQAIRLDHPGLALSIERADLYPLGAPDSIEYPRYGQTAFLGLFFTGSLQNLRIDEDLEIVPRIRDIDDDHALVDVDLGGREPDAGRSIHRLRHVLHELADTVIYPCDRLCPLMQPWIGIMQNRQKSHKKLRSE